MKDSEELFQLVKSLSGPEKRYFKLITSIYGGDKHYLDVFNILVKQKNYNEDALRKKIRDKGVLKQLPRVKNYLYETILKTILIHHTDNSEKSKVNNQVGQIRLLMSKGLFKQSLKIILKSKKMAYVIGHYPTLIEIIRLERRLCLTMLELEKIKSLELESKLVWSHMQTLRDYDMLNDEMFALISQEGKARNTEIIDQAKQIIKHPLLANEARAINYNSKYLYYQVHSFYSELIGDFEACCNYRKALIALMEELPVRLTEFQFNYIIGLNNLMSSLLDLRKYDMHVALLQKLRRIKPQNENNKMWIFIYSYISELDFCLQFGKFEKGIVLEKNITKGIEEYEKKLPTIIKFLFPFNLSLLNFGSGNYSKSLHLLNKALNLPHTDQGKDIQALSKIFNLIIHFELGHEDLLPYLLRSTYRYLLKQQRVYRYETFILQFIRNLGKASSQHQIRNLLIELKTSLENLLKDNFEKHAFGNFDIISWLESKIEKKSFAQIVKEKVK